MSTPADSVIDLLERLRASDPVAARQLWERFFERMVTAARRRLAAAPRRAADEEDAALSAFLSFQRGIAAGRFPDLNSGEGLWELLLLLTRRAAAGQARAERRLKRGGGAVPLGDSALADARASAPAPDDEVAFQEDLADALERLGSGPLRAVALARLEGCTADEIARRLGCAAVTVRRRLHLIRRTWEHLLDDPGKNVPG